MKASIAWAMFPALLASSVAWAQVGLKNVVLADMPVTLTYPTATASRPTTIGPFTVTVAPDAEPLPGRRRLVVISHGSGGSALADHALAAALVREGLVVAQPLHRGDNHRDQRDAGPVSFERRPGEVTRLIDALAADAQWAPRLALDRVGVHGMSAGGVTALALAGAQWRLLNLVRHCGAHGQQDAGFCFTGATDEESRRRRQASFDSARGVPEVFLPAALTTLHGGRTPTADATDPRPDPRIAAATVAVPVAAIFSAESLARVHVPVGVVAADRDEVLLPAYHSSHVLKHCTRCVLLAELPGAGHFDLLSPWPDSVARAVAAQYAQGGLPVAGFDGRLREAAQAQVAAFHRSQLQ